MESDENDTTLEVPEAVNEVAEDSVSSPKQVEKLLTERPSKRARSTFSLVASAMAAGFVLGGTVVISALASIDITQ